MDSHTLLVTFVSSAIAGAIIAAAGVAVGFRLGRRAAITHDGIRQAREVRDRILDGVITPVKLADGSVTHGVIADGAVIQYRLADGAVKRPD